MSAIATWALPEQVLVVPRASVLGRTSWQGFRTREVDGLLAAILREGRYEPRPEVESDPHWKQVIPYLIVRDGARYFLMQRTSAGADARLHGVLTIGVGGHLNPGDGGVQGGLEREWREEIEADFDPEPRFLGLLNDETTDVGRVHLGLVFSADVRGRPLAIRETDKLRGSFASAAEVRAVVPHLETWSQLIFEQLEDPAG